MQKIILALCLALAISHGEAHDEYRSDDFINMNRLQHKEIVKQYDAKLKQFVEVYAERINSVDVHYELISENLEQSSERLNPLALLSDSTKHCVAKYSADIPTIVYVRQAIAQCAAIARSKQSVIIQEAVAVRNNLKNYLENHFENQIQNCTNSTSKYVSCISQVVTSTNKHIGESQKEFLVKLEAALCVAKASVKHALDCSFSVEQDTITEIAKANILVNRCIGGNDECKPCKYYCNDMATLPGSHFANKTMHNPFFGREDHPECMIMCYE